MGLFIKGREEFIKVHKVGTSGLRRGKTSVNEITRWVLLDEELATEPKSRGFKNGIISLHDRQEELNSNHPFDPEIRPQPSSLSLHTSQ
jgi:hypothetical protein